MNSILFYSGIEKDKKGRFRRDGENLKFPHLEVVSVEIIQEYQSY